MKKLTTEIMTEAFTRAKNPLKRGALRSMRIERAHNGFTAYSEHEGAGPGEKPSVFKTIDEVLAHTKQKFGVSGAEGEK
jgi:hypothetical protein